MANNGMKIKDEKDGLKSINLEYWGGLEGFLNATSPGSTVGGTPHQLRRVVPWLAKAVDMTANAVSELPFAIVDESGNEKDTSDDWKNLYGGIDTPDALFYKLASSLCFSSAYLIPTVTGKTIANLQYVAPLTVTPQIDSSGLRFLTRTANDKMNKVNYNPAGPDALDPQMMYFWLPDSDVEIGPAMSYPAGAALLSAKLLFSMDGTIQGYADNGFIQPTILGLKGMPPPAEKEKTENWWDNFLRGRTKQRAKIFNSEAMTVNQLGAGMKDFSGSYNELVKQAIENIGTAFGIPAALFMSDMAFATEVNPMIKVWYSTSVFVKIYKTIEQGFNEQLLSRFNVKLKFRPENLDAFKDSIADNVTAYVSLKGTGMQPSVAASISGLPLPEDKKPEDLDSYDEQQQEKKQEIDRQKLEIERAKQNQDMQNQGNKPVDEPPDDEPKQKPMNGKQIKELALWNQMASRFFRKGKGKLLDFECKYIDDVISEGIRAKLRLANSEDEISKAFEISNVSRDTDTHYDQDGLKALADAINNAAKVESSAKTPTYNFTIPEMKFTGSFPDVPTPVVNVTNQVNPTPINVTNEVIPASVTVKNDVQPTPVNIENNIQEPKKEKEKITVVRDARGNITGMEKK